MGDKTRLQCGLLPNYFGHLLLLLLRVISALIVSTARSGNIGCNATKNLCRGALVFLYALAIRNTFARKASAEKTSTYFFDFNEFVEQRRRVLVELAVQLLVAAAGDRDGGRGTGRRRRAGPRHVTRRRRHLAAGVRRQVAVDGSRIQQRPAAAAAAEIRLRRPS